MSFTVVDSTIDTLNWLQNNSTLLICNMHRSRVVGITTAKLRERERNILNTTWCFRCFICNNRILIFGPHVQYIHYCQLLILVVAHFIANLSYLPSTWVCHVHTWYIDTGEFTCIFILFRFTFLLRLEIKIWTDMDEDTLCELYWSIGGHLRIRSWSHYVEHIYFLLNNFATN